MENPPSDNSNQTATSKAGSTVTCMFPLLGSAFLWTFPTVICDSPAPHNQLHRRNMPRVKEELRHNTTSGIAPWPDSLDSLRSTRRKTHIATIPSTSKIARFPNPPNILRGDPTAWRSGQWGQRRPIHWRRAGAHRVTDYCWGRRRVSRQPSVTRADRL
ncbi:hypothetical protein FA13DRAFT_716296 [Coprinellus micaceus]|uniref:Uncharacterized protein n=1 Tax=Coprinellus micaceus TaxID=71717 RepID=A0A4Y7TVI7_COPMI|nr:hypothetical protein FA13DRAFT_716296 [Coprinellus micaceus]